MTDKFRTGVYHLHGDPNFNYQLNRLVMWNSGDLEEVRRAAEKITDCGTWERELSALGEKALSENRFPQASGYFRMAEFFMFRGNPDKMRMYDRSRELFYRCYADRFGAGEGQIRIDHIPYGDAYLPCWHLQANGGCKDVIVLHGGNDSSIEEFLLPVLSMGERGFEVYCFEGPGQGEALKKCGLVFTYEWEKPVKAVLDYYRLTDVTLVGISLGSMLAARAAAFESRVGRVVAWSVQPNLLDVALATRPAAVRFLMKFLLRTRQKGVVDFVFSRMRQREELVRWAGNHASEAYGIDDPYEYCRASDKYDMLRIAGQIRQDFLLLGAREDHFVDFSLYKEEIDALENVHSLTFRVFNRNEQAENHCSTGNSRLACDTVLDWIESVKRNRAAEES